MKLKKILTMVTLSMFISVGAFASNDDIKVDIDGVTLKTDVPAQAVNGRTLVPLRAIFDEYGIEVYWNQRVQVIQAFEHDDRWFDMTLGLDSNMAMINDKVRYLDQPPIAINGRTMVPVRFISEILGSDVSWDQQTKTVNIVKKPINVIEATDYEKAFTDFLYEGGLQNTLDKSFEEKYLDLTNLDCSFYDIDGDGIPELLMDIDVSQFDMGHYNQRGIYEFKNGEIKTLYDEMQISEQVGSPMSSTFYHDPIKKELYSRNIQKYTIWIERYNKKHGFKDVYDDSSAGGQEIIYYDPNFNPESIEELKMQPYYNIDFFDEGDYEPSDIYNFISKEISPWTQCPWGYFTFQSIHKYSFSP